MIEPAETPHPRPSRRRAWGPVAAGLVALAAGTVLAIVGLTGVGTKTTTTTVVRAIVPGAEETAAMLAGIPQHGIVLGRPTAPVTLVEWADLQCPFCREWATNAFPAIVRDYVRTGKVQLVFRGLAFLGPDSQRALQVALAAGVQNRLWHVVDLLYRLQGIENSGWATDAILHEITQSVAGLDQARLYADANGGGVRATMLETGRAGNTDHVSGTPTFDIGRTGAKTFRRFNPSTLDAAAFKPAIEQLLKRG